LCISAFGVSKIHSARAKSTAISELETQWRKEVASDPDRSLWSTQPIAHYELARSQSDELLPIALLNIPSVDIRVAVFEGTSDRVLDIGVGRVSGTAEIGVSGNLALAGHRNGYFRGLKDIAIGDEISIQHADGIDHYSVTELLVVKPDAIHVLDPTAESILTLVTCYPFYFVGSAPERFIVRAVSKQTAVFSQ